MGATDSYRKAHAEIMEIVRSIESILAAQKGAGDAGGMRSLLSGLLGKLNMHLAVEDNSLYPRLIKHQDAKLRETALRFSSEMSGLKPAVEAFGRKWTESAIRADGAAFRADAAKLFDLLKDRIQRENTQFYPLVDQAG